MNPQDSTATPDRNVSPWTFKQKIGRMLWAVVASTFFHYSFHSWYGFRAMLLRLFGGQLGRNVRIRRTARIQFPWNLVMGNDVSVGDFAILYSLGTIRIGDRSFVSQYGHLCAGSHDARYSTYPLIKPPIVIGSDCWIAADAFVGPGVTVGDRSVVGARASVFADVPEGVIVAGNPAKMITNRELSDEH